MQLFENEMIRISNIHSVILSDSEKVFSKGPIRHFSKIQFHELIFHLSGESIAHFDDNVIYDTPGSIRYLPQGGGGGEYWVENLSPSLCVDIFFETEDSMPTEALSLKNMDSLKPLFEKIYQVWNKKSIGYYAECMSILYEIIRKLQRYNHRQYKGNVTDKIRPSLDYMMAHFSESNFNFSEMGAQSGLSYDYFKELFVKEYGMPPIRYLTHLRLTKAKELLLTGRYSVTEIAELCGYENVYYFSNVFKKHVGVSPKQYRE